MIQERKKKVGPPPLVTLVISPLANAETSMRNHQFTITPYGYQRGERSVRTTMDALMSLVQPLVGGAGGSSVIDSVERVH